MVIRVLRIVVATIATMGASIAILYATSPAPSLAVTLPPCALSGVEHVQICPVSFNATAGSSSPVTVAQYADFSQCNEPAPSNYPGSNQNYTVASVTINWGDGSAPTSGVAHTGTTCPSNDSVYTNPGEVEPITGVHLYAKSGVYTVSVSITYLRGAGDTFENCAIFTPGDTVYNRLTNCIALGAPVQSIAVVAEAAKAPSIKIEQFKVTSSALDVKVKTSAAGTVTITDRALRRTVVKLAAGVHTVKVPLSSSGRRDVGRHARIKVSVSLNAGTSTVGASEHVRL